MTDWTTIRVRTDAKQAAEARKPDCMTWSEFLAAEEYDPDVDVHELVNAIAAEADGRGRVDDDELARAVARKIDYAELANAVASELETRLR